jgi:hypothetical protein
MLKTITLILLLFGINYTNAQKSYFFSSSTGKDTNAGSEALPFQTISKLNSLVLSAGEKVFFKRGDTFIGQINVLHSGSIGAPIVYDSYGTGDLPILSASNGKNGISDPLSTIKIVGKEYLEFHNLRIENERFDAESGSPNDQSYGIYITSSKTLPVSGNFEDAVLFKHFRFSNLSFQNIYSLSSTATEFNNIRSSGIHFFTSYANDVIIEDCDFTDIERVGIWLRSYVSDAIIRNNKFIDLGGSGTIISGSRRVLYEKNLMRFTGSDADPRMTKRGSGMWVFGSRDIVAQYNISQHARGEGDSSGMHVDYSNNNVLFQYNYSEDSAGGFCETLGKNDNIIWRYNISVNDGTTDKSGKNRLLWVSDYAGTVGVKSTNVYVYNNTIYQGLDYKNVIGDSEISLKATSLNFINNIIYLEPTAKLGEKLHLFDVNVLEISNNVMYGGTIKTNFKNLDATKIEKNPLFYDTGSRHFSGYKLLKASPAIGTALSFMEPSFPLAGTGIFKGITSNATKDIFGNPVNLSSTSNIGAYNGSGETIAPKTTVYQAETATTVGGSEINCINASNGKAVDFLASGMTLTFNNINTTNAGLYIVNVFYANPFKSNLKIRVNGGDSQTVILPYSNAYCFNSGIPTNFPLILALREGSNTITFENGVFDKIEVMSVSDAILSTEIDVYNKSVARLEKRLLTKDDNLRLILDEKTDFTNTEVVIYDISGAFIIKKNFNFPEISLETQSFGSGMKIVVARIGSYLFVDKIIVH